jgi:hypothetical protein
MLAHDVTRVSATQWLARPVHYRGVGRSIMYKLLRMAVLALPLTGGVALAQGSAVNGPGNAPDPVTPLGTQGTTDTRTPTQKRAGELDDNAATAVPGDATKPRNVPETAPMSDRAGMPESADRPNSADQKSTDVDRSPGALDHDTKAPRSDNPANHSDLQHDQNDSDK